MNRILKKKLAVWAGMGNNFPEFSIFMTYLFII